MKAVRGTPVSEECPAVGMIVSDDTVVTVNAEPSMAKPTNALGKSHPAGFEDPGTE